MVGGMATRGRHNGKKLKTNIIKCKHEAQAALEMRDAFTLKSLEKYLPQQGCATENIPTQSHQ